MVESYERRLNEGFGEVYRTLESISASGRLMLLGETKWQKEPQVK
jgi:hypothetical protein